MFKSFHKISFRNLVRQKGYSIINLSGLTLGLTVGFTIFLYIFNELSYDNYHKNPEQIYRVSIKGNLGDMPIDVAVTPGVLGQNLKKDMPEVKSYTKFEYQTNDHLFSAGENKFYENHLVFADNYFSDIFAIQFIYGDQQRALLNPYSMVLTKSVSDKLFPGINPVGEQVKLNNNAYYNITGVIEDLPDETHLPINVIASFETLVRENGTRILEEWGSLMYYTYIRLYPGVNLEAFKEKLSLYINHKMRDDLGETNINLYPYLQNVKEIHLQSNILGELATNGEMSYIYILMAIAIGILFIAGINFMNLSTARSSNRAKEVSIRKIYGASKWQLIIQFLGESVFLSMISCVISMSLIELILPVFNNLTSINIQLNYSDDGLILLFFLSIAFIFGIFSGSYPAFFLSSFKPIKILSSKLKSGNTNKGLRNVLVFIQFVISSGLIIATIIIYLQLNYIQNKELGFDKENLIYINLRNEEIQKKAAVLKEKLMNIPGVSSTSLANSIPGMSLSGSSYFPEGYSSDPWLVYNFEVDEDFIKNSFKMNIIEGRNFSPLFPTDSNAVIINETLKNKLAWDNAINKTFSYNEDSTESMNLHVIGVVEDFHFRSLHETIEPTMMHFQQSDPRFLVIRMQTKSTEYTLKNIHAVWNEFVPELPFDYEFISVSFNNLYSSEKKLSMLFSYLTIFAIFIASLGLFGLVSFTAEQRTKEIGVRKVLGASVYSISKMLSIEYLRLIVLANFFSWPLSYLLMNKWLNSFSYHTPIPIWTYILAFFISLLTSLFIVNIQAIKTSSENPIKSLRYE